MANITIILIIIGIFVNKISNLYNFCMKLNAKEFVKLILLKECLTQKELALILSEKTDKKYTQDGLSRKLNRGTIAFNEVVEIADLLGYEIYIERKKEA